MAAAMTPLDKTSDDSLDVAIVGAGLAGARAAVTLARMGYRVGLFERNKAPGGRAGTFPDKELGPLDVGQHVALGCCTEYLRFLDELGTSHLAPLQKRLDIPMIDGGNVGEQTGAKASSLSAIALPYPFSLVGAILRFDLLTPGERLHTLSVVNRANWEYRRSLRQKHSRTTGKIAAGNLHETSQPFPNTKEKDRKASKRGRTFEQWLIEQGVSTNALEVLWEPLIVATLNSLPGDVDVKAGLMVVALGLCQNARSAAVAIPQAPLADLLSSLPEVLAPKGQMHFSSRVFQVEFEENRAIGIRLHSGERVKARAVIVASAHPDVARLLPDSIASHPYFTSLTRLLTRPIVNVHLWYERAFTNQPMIGIVRSPLQWLFDLTSLWKKENGEPGRHYCVSISAADRYMDMPMDFVASEIDSEIRRVFRLDDTNRLLTWRVRKMRHATFQCTPESEDFRPTNKTPFPGLYLAGDFTDTGWPSTMESAVRSGEACAREIIRSLAGGGS